MTTGSINRDSFTNYAPTGGWYGAKGLKSWSGADSPSTAHWVRSEPRYVTRRMLGESGRMERFRTMAPAYSDFLASQAVERPPKRGRREEHAYTMQDLRLTDELVTLQGIGVNYNPLPVMQFCAVPQWSATTLLDANDEIRLVNKLKEQLQGSDFNMSVFLGEGHQTLKLVADSAVRIAKAGHYARKGDLKGAVRSLFEGTSRAPLKKRPAKWDYNVSAGDLRTASSNWLELQYGWRPLLQDVAGAAEMLAHQLNVPFQQTYRSSVRRESLQFRNGFLGFNDSGPFTTASVRVHRRSLIARIKEDSTSMFAKLGLQDPELVAWELMPFSFVADWFIPIGSWMEARAAAGRLQGTFIYSDLRTGTCYTPVSSSFATTPRARYDSTIFDRSISSTLKVPLPEFKPLSKVASWQHCANALALVTQVFTSKTPLPKAPEMPRSGGRVFNWGNSFRP